MKLIEKNDNQIVFSSGMNETLANALRRYVNRILVLAVDELEISRNDSPLYDETVAHRVGLVPLKSGKSVGEKSKGELKLETKKEGVVYSSELKGKPEPVYGKIPLTTLDKGQELKFNATVKSGRGVDHSKFAPGIMFYRNLVELTLDKEFLDALKKICPDNEIKEKGQKIVILDNKKREIADVCGGLAERNKKKIEVLDKGELVITIESFGQMDANNIFIVSIDTLKEDLKQFSKEVKKI